ncbi:hypothetical protein [Buttiauxella agrestis]|uniref:hypothetical protein n=1 Tax=Buttiauxella agrestis TaxID=82977 RepID=UPI003974CCEE
MHIFKTLIVFITFGITACGPKAEYIPEGKNLKSATVGVPYLYKIDILGGAVTGGSERRIGFVFPENTGISLRNCPMEKWRITAKTRDPFDYNCVEVYGIPTKPGVIKIIIGGGMYGNMFASAIEFSKEYKINVTQP